MLIYQAIQYAISGITAGSIYAIVGICWSTVFLISGVLNFSTGEFVMLGGMLTWLFMDRGLSFLPAMLFAVAGTVFVAMGMERLVIRPVRYPSETTFMLIITDRARASFHPLEIKPAHRPSNKPKARPAKTVPAMVQPPRRATTNPLRPAMRPML